MNKFDNETSLEDKIKRIVHFEKIFKKSNLVVLYLNIVKAKTFLQNNEHKQCYDTMLKAQIELKEIRKTPKQLLSLANEVWAAYFWQREDFMRCHQSLLSFLVYSNLNKLSLFEKNEVIYRLIICK